MTDEILEQFLSITQILIVYEIDGKYKFYLCYQINSIESVLEEIVS